MTARCWILGCGSVAARVRQLGRLAACSWLVARWVTGDAGFSGMWRPWLVEVLASSQRVPSLRCRPTLLVVWTTGWSLMLADRGGCYVVLLSSRQF